MVSRGSSYLTSRVSRSTPPNIATPIVEETVPALAERQIISKANFIVASPNISINIWDDRREDGDIVSLFFNGEAVLE